MESANVLKVPNKSFGDFYLLFCGYSECEPLHSFGPAVRPNFLIHIIISGKGKYFVNNQVYPIKQGRGFLIEPDVLTRYEADQDDPWTYIWIGFDGENCRKHLNNIGLGGHQLIFHTKHGDELKDIVMEMLENHSYDIKEEYLLQSLLYKFFSVMVDQPMIPNKKNKANDNEYVRKAIGFIQHHYINSIKVSDIADFVSLNRSYLSSVFKRETGISIQEYLSDFRLSRAAELLTLTDLSIEQISRSCGYTDPLVFSKSFKKKKGINPTQYRKMDSKRVSNHFQEDKPI